ncbi:MAG: CPBP family intramembrane metalloprotease, partial [Chloroflexi bacterium]|nr:CPBP family intramembrane metalloprotease [Chloroflexota bacterium]
MKDLQACTASPFGSCTVRTLAVTAGIVFLYIAYKLVHPEQFIITAIITLAVWLSRRFLDRQSFRSLGLNDWNPDDLVNGFVALVIPLVIVSLVQWLTGWATLKGWGMDAAGRTYLPSEMLGGLFSAFVIAGLTAWREELLFRGYLLDNLQRGTGWLWGIILSSIFFGFLHIILTPNAFSLTLAQQISIVTLSSLAGLVL